MTLGAWDIVGGLAICGLIFAAVGLLAGAVGAILNRWIGPGPLDRPRKKGGR